jgi:FSR family fosmidomycin resistance protein-like MFS transporter
MKMGFLPLFVLAHFSHHVLTAIPIPLLPMIRSSFALDYTQSGLAISAFTLSYGIAQLPAGWLADRVGPRLLITTGISGVALGGLLVGLSHTYIMMTLFLVLMGLAGGGYHPAASPLISMSVEPEKRGRALGFHLIGGSTSYFLAPLMAAAIASAWGWRGSFVGLAVPTIVFGVVFYVLLGRRVKVEEKEQSIADSHGETAPAPGHVRHLAAFIMLSTFTWAVISSTIAFIPLFMVDHFGVGEETAASLLAIIYSAGLWAGPLGGYLSDRLGRVPVILAVSFISGPIMYLLNLVSYGPGFGALLLVIGTILIMRAPVAEAYIVGQSSRRQRSTILGIYFFSGHEGSGVLTPVMGYLIDRLGFYPSFTIASAALFTVTLGCSLLLWDSRD